MVNLAKVYGLNLKFERSISLLEDVLKRRRDKFGPDHPDSLDVMLRLGSVYRDAGRLSKAIDVLEQARAKALAIPGFSGDGLVWISTPLCEAYEGAGQLAKAESLCRETLETFRQGHNGVSSASVALQVVLARNLLKQQRCAEAEPLLRECLKFREEIEPHDWTTFNTKSMLGGSLTGQKKYDEAEPLLLAGYEGMKQRAGTYRPRLTEAIERLVQLYDAWGQPEKAAEWRAKLPPAAAELPADVFARPEAARR
jgi:tetratricopeptide (TPR) repeat protein